MISNNQIKELQQRYFDFCTGLIKKIPHEIANPDALMMEAFSFRDELEKAVIQNEIECKNEAIKEIEVEIGILKNELENK